MADIEELWKLVNQLDQSTILQPETHRKNGFHFVHFIGKNFQERPF